MKNNWYGIFLWLVISITFTIPANGQFEDIIHKSYKEKTGPLNQILKKVREKPDSAAIIIEQFKKTAIAENDLEAELEAKILWACHYGSIHGITWEQKIVKELLEVVEISSKNHLLQTEARAFKALTWFYWHMICNYELASDYYIKLDEVLQQLPDDEFPDKVDCLLALGSCYHFFGDFEKAKNYFLRAVTIKETPVNAMALGSCMNSLGVCYRDLGMLDSSDRIFNRFLLDSNSLAYNTWEGIVAGNLGFNYYLRGDYEQAIPLFLHDKTKALENSDFSLAAGACTPLADIYIYQNRIEEAGKEIKEARLYIQLTKQFDRLRKLFPVMSKWYSKTGKPDLAVAYMDSTLIAIKQYQEKRDAMQLLRANQRSEIEKNKITVLKIQREKEQTIFIRNLVIISLAFMLVLLIIFVWNRNKRHQQEQLIKDLKIQEHEVELAGAKNQLVEFSRRITEKNELIEKLEKESRLIENNELLVELRQSAILTEEDWIRFKRVYEQVYPNFFQKLKDTFPDLSPAEIRYITLSKLGFNSNEVANCLGISKKSIHVTWHRIRKKLALSESQTVNDLVIQLD